MKRIFDILKIRREECWPALFMLLIFTALNALVIYKYYSIFTPIGGKYWPLFIHNFHLSGFDPITYAVVSDWSAGYNVYRHPLLAFYMFIPYLLNQGLMWLTGINCAIFIVAAIQIFCALYAFLFLFRILREIVGVHYFDVFLLLLCICHTFSYGSRSFHHISDAVAHCALHLRVSYEASPSVQDMAGICIFFAHCRYFFEQRSEGLSIGTFRERSPFLPS